MDTRASISTKESSEFDESESQSKSWLDSQLGPSTPDNDASSNTKPPGYLERIASLPKIRELPWRPGQALGAERSTDSPRVQQKGACLVATRGKIADVPCEHCTGGYGRFSQCITLGDWFQGACATCIFTSKGNKCSLRKTLFGKKRADVETGIFLTLDCRISRRQSTQVFTQ